MEKEPAAPPIDASEYFKCSDLSDVNKVIREHGVAAADAMVTDTADPQQRELRLPGHNVLLSACSSLYKSMVRCDTLKRRIQCLQCFSLLLLLQLTTAVLLLLHMMMVLCMLDTSAAHSSHETS
jgi:hypothetical protein